ncbi:reverse transcriptase [Elysia marginata]|uniref:Reverse transcriptase n=1 Tax=Elysia marginata TaxID=1093978 RepID=A0AAV4EE90_9GAST|nr:reverse transcriptase [Elysia marginata]
MTQSSCEVSPKKDAGRDSRVHHRIMYEDKQEALPNLSKLAQHADNVESIEAKINKYTRKWLGIPPGLSDVAMYCRKAKLKLQMKSIFEEYKCGKVRLVIMLEDSDDPVVKTVQPSTKTGRKWKVAEAIDEAKECLKMKEVIGQTQTDRKGLGSSSVKWWSRTEGKEKRGMIIDEVRQKKKDFRRIQRQSSKVIGRSGKLQSRDP